MPAVSDNGTVHSLLATAPINWLNEAWPPSGTHMSFLWMLLLIWLGVTVGYGFLLPRNDEESPLAQIWFDNRHPESLTRRQTGDWAAVV